MVPPVLAVYQLKVPALAAEALRVTVEFPQVLPEVVVTTGGCVIVAVTDALPLVQEPLPNST